MILRRFFGLESGLFTGRLAIGNRDLVQLSIASVVHNTATTRHYVVLVIVAILLTGLMMSVVPMSGLLGLLLGRIYAYDIAIYALAIYQAFGQYGEFERDEGRVAELVMANPDGPTVAANFALPEVHKWRSFLILLAGVESLLFTAVVVFDPDRFGLLQPAVTFADDLQQHVALFGLLVIVSTAFLYLHLESVRLARMICLNRLMYGWRGPAAPLGFLVQNALIVGLLGVGGLILGVYLTVFAVLGMVPRLQMSSFNPAASLAQTAAWLLPAALVAILVGWAKRLIARMYLAWFCRGWAEFASASKEAAPQSP